jgi:glycine dehydrogenase subunit 1
LLGAEGLHQVASNCHLNTQKLVQRLTAISGVTPVFSSPYFHEVVLQFDRPLEPILTALGNAGIEGGYAIEAHYPTLKNALLICATEMRTDAEINHYAKTLEAIMSERSL